MFIIRIRYRHTHTHTHRLANTALDGWNLAAKAARGSFPSSPFAYLLFRAFLVCVPEGYFASRLFSAQLRYSSQPTHNTIMQTGAALRYYLARFFSHVRGGLDVVVSIEIQVILQYLRHRQLRYICAHVIVVPLAFALVVSLSTLLSLWLFPLLLSLFSFSLLLVPDPTAISSSPSSSSFSSGGNPARALLTSRSSCS